MKLTCPFIYPFIGAVAFFLSCSKEEDDITLDSDWIYIQKSVPPLAIIAHRGTCYWAPESTEAAFRWARQVGATYLEFDLRRTKDGYLVAYHDDYLWKTTDVLVKYPLIKKPSIGDFTLEELLNLDMGSWFNNKYPQFARNSFAKLDILTLEDIIRIAEGWKIKRGSMNKRIFTKKDGKIVTVYEKDPADNGNRPGIYPETKNPELYPGIESDIKTELERLGWYALNISDLKNITTYPERVNTGNTPARVIIQTFSPESLSKLNGSFTRLIPFCFLLAIKNDDKISKNTYNQWLVTALKNRAVIVGVCIQGPPPDNFGDLLETWMYDLIKEKKLLIHAYTFQTKEQIFHYMDMTDGFFCNQADDLLHQLTLLGKKPNNLNNGSTNGSKILDALGY